MTLTIFVGFRRRWKAFVERMSFSGRVRRLARTRQELTLESLERFVRGGLQHPKKPPWFLVPRYIFFGERATRPWITNDLVQEEHDAFEKHWGRPGGPTVMLNIRAMYLSIAVSVPVSMGILGYVLAHGLDSSFLYLVSFGPWCCLGLFGLFCVSERQMFAHRVWEKHKGEIVSSSVVNVQGALASAAMLRRVEWVLHGMKQELVGDGSVHARNVERVREHQRRLGELKVRLEKRIHEGGGGPITHLSNADGTSDVEASRAPEHLRIALEGVVCHLETAASALAGLDDFMARVDALFTEAEGLLRDPIRRYDDLDLIRDIETEGVALGETAASVRRDIDAALVVLEERIIDIRSQVTDSAELIGDIVAALPDIDRSGGRDVGEELERIVKGLMTDTRVKQIA